MLKITLPDNTVLEAMGTLTNPASHSTDIRFTVTSTDPVYGPLPIADASVTIFDNECGAWGYNGMDFNTDCIVNLADFADFAAQWLNDDNDPQI